MGKLAGVFLMLATVCLTAAVTVTYTAPDSSRPDLTPLWIIGGGAVALAFVIESSVVRRMAYRFEALRPPFQTTQRYLGVVVVEGKDLLGRLNGYSAHKGDEEGEKFWNEQVQIWTDWASEIIKWRLPDLADSFMNEADRDASPIWGIPWRRHLQSWMQVRMKRINEYVQGAPQFQGELGRKPSRIRPPRWSDPPSPTTPTQQSTPSTPEAPNQ